MGSVLSNIEIKVTPQALYDESSNMSANIAVLRNAFASLEEVILATEGNWQGEAADGHRKMFTQSRTYFELAATLLSEYPNDLMQIAGNYISVENNSLAEAEALPSDAIV